MTGRSEMFRYRACGLSIQADAPITGTRQVAPIGRADLHVRFKGGAAAPRINGNAALWYRSPYEDSAGIPLLTVHALDSTFFLQYSEGARFLVDRAGSEIDVWWDEPLTAADAADYLLGSVLAFVVRLHGMVPLHASGVVIAERAVLFAGAAGAGKSSIAAAFAVLGCPVISDDVVAIAVAGDGALAYPSHPRVSIWADSAQGLFATMTLPTHSAVYPKHRLDLIDGGFLFHETAVPIERLFILSDRRPDAPCPSIRLLPARAALVELVTHSYGNYLLDASMRACEFELLGRIASSVRVERLSFGEGFETLVSSCRQLIVAMGVESGTALLR